jgi:prefoldin subunit 5
LLPTIKSLSPAVPLISSRLQALSETHHRVAQYDSALVGLETNIKDLNTSISDSHELLKTLENSLQKNLETMNENFASLNS